MKYRFDFKKVFITRVIKNQAVILQTDLFENLIQLLSDCGFQEEKDTIACILSSKAWNEYTREVNNLNFHDQPMHNYIDVLYEIYPNLDLSVYVTGLKRHIPIKKVLGQNYVCYVDCQDVDTDFRIF